MYLATCATCQSVFQPLVCDDKMLEEWYGYRGPHLSNKTMTPLLRRRLSRLLRPLERYRLSNQLLEVGCGGGLLARAATEQGWQVFGTEISSTCCAVLRPLLGSRLHQGALQGAPFERKIFDVVVMMELIEHLPDPGGYLIAAQRYLRPGGCLVLTTPNLKGLTARTWGQRWRVINDEHLNYFDERTIRRLLSDHGYTDVVVATSGIDVGMYVQEFRQAVVGLYRKRESSEGANESPERKAVADSKGTFMAAAIDLAMETVNLVLNFLSLGDVLKVRALKPPTGDGNTFRLGGDYIGSRVNSGVRK